MPLRLKLENDKIKEYPTHRSSRTQEAGEKPHHYTKCGLRFEDDPEIKSCNHLDCALDVPVSETKEDALLGILFPILMFFAVYLERGDFSGSIQYAMGTLVIWGIFSVIMALLHYMDWSELNEFKRHGTIHGLKASKL